MMFNLNDVQSICAPLFRLTNIDFFFYGRYYRDGSIMLLSSNGEHQKDFLGNSSYSIFDWEIINNLVKDSSNILTKKTVYFSPSDILPSSLLSYYANKFNMRTGIEIVEKLDNKYEIFWFHSSSKKNLKEFYLNNLDVLAKFITYFREQAAQLISDSEKSKIIIPSRCRCDRFKNFILSLSNKGSFETLQLRNLHKTLNIRKYSINRGGKLVNITNRERECLLYLEAGLPAKKTGSLMGISPKTVQNHLQNLRDKLGVFSKEQLLSVYRDSIISKIKDNVLGDVN